MTIREVLDVDWTVAWIRVTIRDLQERFVAEYVIGKDVKPHVYCRYQCEAEGGSVYDDGGRKYVFINRIMQHSQLDKCTTREKARSVGVLLTEIPAALLDLEIKHMRPEGTGRSDDLHGYSFTCRVFAWDSLSDEREKEQGELT